VARVVYSRNALENIKRVLGSLSEVAPDAARATFEAIESAINLLGHHPFIGRSVDDELRELVISFGKTGYLALYTILPDAIVVLAVRHQRELDYDAYE